MRLVVTGTDTDVGKTVFSAALAGAASACYWKPFQAGTEPSTDSETFAELSGLPASRIFPEAYRLRTPASIHFAAEAEGIAIDCDRIEVPRAGRLIVEGAGGPLVPVTRRILLADLFVRWRLPVVIVARTRLGTISHTLLAIEALRGRGLDLSGVAFVGEANEDSERTICEIGGVRRLGRLPLLEPLDRSTLAAAFAANFRIGDFL